MSAEVVWLAEADEYDALLHGIYATRDDAVRGVKAMYTERSTKRWTWTLEAAKSGTSEDVFTLTATRPRGGGAHEVRYEIWSEPVQVVPEALP